MLKIRITGLILIELVALAQANWQNQSSTEELCLPTGAVFLSSSKKTPLSSLPSPSASKF